MSYFYIRLKRWRAKGGYGDHWITAIVPAHKEGMVDSDGTIKGELAFQDGLIKWYPLFRRYFKKDTKPWWEDAHWIAPLSSSGEMWFHTRDAKDVVKKLPRIIEKIKAEQWKDKAFVSDNGLHISLEDIYKPIIDIFVFKLSVLLEWAKLYQDYKTSFTLFFWQY